MKCKAKFANHDGEEITLYVDRMEYRMLVNLMNNQGFFIVEDTNVKSF